MENRACVGFFVNLVLFLISIPSVANVVLGNSSIISELYQPSLMSDHDLTVRMQEIYRFELVNNSLETDYGKRYNGKTSVGGKFEHFRKENMQNTSSFVNQWRKRNPSILLPQLIDSTNSFRRRITRQTHGTGVVVADRLGLADNECSIQTLCHSKLTNPYVCYWNNQACDGVQNCATGRDEIFCNDCIPCAYNKTRGVILDTTSATTSHWADMNLKGCARLCNEILVGCIAFAFSPFLDGLDRCIAYKAAKARWLSKPGTDMYVRTYPSTPRLVPPNPSSPVTSIGSQIIQGSTLQKDQGDCTQGDQYKCTDKKQSCIPYSQLCDGFKQCPGLSEEIICPVVGGIWSKSSKSTISSYIVPFPGMTFGSCAAYCVFHSSGSNHNCDVFSYSSIRKECRIGCTTCSEKLSIYPAEEFDYFVLDPQSSTSSLLGLANIVGIVKPGGLAPSIQASVTSIASRYRDRGVSVTNRPFAELFSLFTTSSPQITPAPTQPSSSPVTFTVAPSPVPSPNTEISSSQGFVSSFLPPNSDENNSPSFITGASTPNSLPSAQTTPPLFSSQLPAVCGRRPLGSPREQGTRSEQVQICSPQGVCRTESRVLSSDTENRLVSGSVATVGAYPWQVQIQAFNTSGFWEHHCGAVLISSRHVLTAAHCVARSLTRLQVVVGQHDRRDVGEQHEQFFAIENALLHPEYRTRSSSAYANDIALLKLRLRQGREVQFSTHVQPICLPAPNSSPSIPSTCEISGWGKTDPLAPNVPSSAADVLHGGTVPLISDTFCSANEVYGARYLPERMICAGYIRGGTDACQGDSGGPLACQGAGGSWIVQGIVSYGSGCGGELRPGVYTEVGYFVNWISRVIDVI